LLPLILEEIMGASCAVAIAFVIASPLQVSNAIKQEEIEYQSQNFQQWWGSELEWKFDELPTEGSVATSRMPYSGHIYLDKSGGTMQVMRKYDMAFHRGRGLATAYEKQDTSQKEPQWERRGIFGLRRVRVDRVPNWYGHCNGWTSAAIRHAEPQRSVVRNGVTFTPADIKGLLAEIYMYNDTEFLGGMEASIHPGTLHVILCNWVGRGSHPLGMEAAVGEEVWNYPIYAYSTSHAKRGETEVEVKVNVGYMHYSNGEYDRSPRITKTKYFHYALQLNDDGEIIGGAYYRDSSRIDMLWAPLRPRQGGTEGNQRGNPHVDVDTVLAIWRESVPEAVRANWYNIDPPDEDRVEVPGQAEEHPEAETDANSATEADDEGAVPSADQPSAPAEAPADTPDDLETAEPDA
jgi:hypothetical protein